MGITDAFDDIPSAVLRMEKNFVVLHKTRCSDRSKTLSVREARRVRGRIHFITFEKQHAPHKYIRYAIHGQIQTKKNSPRIDRGLL